MNNLVPLISGVLVLPYLIIDMNLNWLYKYLTCLAIFQLSTIWAETADNARSAARTFVLGGLSEKYHGISNFYVADRINVRILCFNFTTFYFMVVTY